MNFKSATLGVATIDLIAVPAAADARTQMRGVGLSTASPNATRARSQQAARNLSPLNLASVK